MPDDAGDHQDGDAAAAIRTAEVALAQQNSVTAQVDLQVVTAILNAHQKVQSSRAALDGLQRDVESAVATRSDLDTPAGARDFQRYLIGKLRDIQAVVAGANLDDTSTSALMAAWTSLYSSAQPGSDSGADDPTPEPAASNSAQYPSRATGPTLDPYLDSLPDDEFLTPEDLATGATSPAPASARAPVMPSMPSFGGGGFPGGSGFGLPTSLPVPTATEGSALSEFDDPDSERDRECSDDEPASDDREPPPEPPAAASGPTTVTLPTGETLTAASPQLAAAIDAATSGTPIADAFAHEGMAIPSPGTAVSDPLDPATLAPGDIGIYTDRHALALGESRAFVNGQIQDVSTVTGPSFLGWQHPPVPVTASGTTDVPAPTRLAVPQQNETA